MTVFKRPGVEFVYELQPGDTWTPHPAGGILVCNPERKPLWCHLSDDGRYYVQEFIEPAYHAHGWDEQDTPANYPVRIILRG